MCTTVNLNILSLNVRGIREQTKRRSIFSYLKDQKANIYFLQETYSEPADEILWKNEWNGVATYSFPMALIIVKVYAFLINPSVNYQIILTILMPTPQAE